jgi:glutathione S-transferase
MTTRAAWTSLVRVSARRRAPRAGAGGGSGAGSGSGSGAGSGERVRRFADVTTDDYISLDDCVNSQAYPAHEGIDRAVAGTLLGADETRLLRAELLRKIVRVEEALADGDVLVGPAITIADAALFSRLESFSTLGISLADFPRIGGWMRTLRERPAFRTKEPPSTLGPPPTTWQPRL